MTENDTIDFEFFEKKDLRFNCIEESNLALKGFLKQDIIIPPHMEVDVFLKSNIVDLQCEKVQIKGITSLTKENIIVYNDREALVTVKGIIC